MFYTKYPILSALADGLCCRASVATIILLSGILTASAMAMETDTSQANLPAPAPDVKEMPTFDILEYKVDGNSLLTTLEVENAVARFMGEGKTLRDVQGARAALERAYHDAGYLTVVVSIPEQSVDTGVVSLQVVEADIEKLKVKGSQYALPSKIKSQVSELAKGKVPNFNTMQNQLTALNRSADVKVTPILRAGEEPGKVDVQLDVEDQLALHGSLEFSNRQSPYTSTSLRTSASIRYDNLWQRGHSFGLTLQAAPENLSDQRVVAGNYAMPVDSAGDTMTLYAVRSRSKLAILTDELLGNSDTLGTRFTLPLTGSSKYSQTFSAGLDYKNVKPSQTSNSPIKYVPLVAAYTGILYGQNRSTTLDVTTTNGLRGLFGNSDVAFNAKRDGASASFMVLRTGLQHTENFLRWALNGKLEIQLASGPLVPTEQLVAGGADTVRGYLEGEQAGDAGTRARIELRTPQYSPGGKSSSLRVSSLAFFDAAQLKIRQAAYLQPDKQSLRSIGLGLRLTASHGLAIDLDAAHALLNGAPNLNDGGYFTTAGEWRMHARALWTF